MTGFIANRKKLKFSSSFWKTVSNQMIFNPIFNGHTKYVYDEEIPHVTTPLEVEQEDKLNLNHELTTLKHKQSKSYKIRVKHII